MNRLAAVVAMAAVALAGCDPETVGTRTAALEDSAWKVSQWISVKEAKVSEWQVGGHAANWKKPVARAADGTSWFATEIANAKAVKKATWMTCALGVYDIYVNGRRVGTDFLKPGFTHVRKTRRSFTYDVTDAIARGEGEKNTFAAEVSAGWWRDKIVNFIGKKSAFRGVLRLEYEDGTTVDYGTDPKAWKSGVAGAVMHAAIFDGEEYDARFPQPAKMDELTGTTEANDEFKGEILPSDGAEVTLRWDLAMRKGPYDLKKGEKLVIDFGQNCAGVPAFRFRAGRGTVLTCLPAEMINDADEGVRGCDGPKGSVYRANLRCPKIGMRAVYTFAGGGDFETYVPRFTFFGYRYVELSATDDVEIDEIASVPVTSIKAEMEIGRLETGVPVLNRFIANVYWGMLSNYLSVPTDCPQRNERLGWTADTQVFADAGAYIADTRRFFSKWMRDMRDTQGAQGGFPGVAPYGQYGSEESNMMRIGWADAGVIVPWKIFRQFGERAIVDENWAAMERFVDHVAATKYEHTAVAAESGNYQWADWLSLENLESAGGGTNPEFCAFRRNAKGQRDVKNVKPEALRYWDFLGGVSWMLDTEYMLDMAAATGRDTAKWEKMLAEAKAYVKRNFFNTPDGTVDPTFGDMQTPLVFALRLGLVEGEAKAKTIATYKANVAKNGNTTGFLGSSILMDTLVMNGLESIAVDLLLKRSFPSWLYSVDQGATTIWERWNGWTIEKGFGAVSMNSYNHYAYGAVLGWMYRSLAGIAPDARKPGFRHLVMKPIVDERLGYVTAEYNSAAGLIKSEWRFDGDEWIWNFTIPENSTASVYVPGESRKREYTGGSYEIRKKKLK